MSSGNLKLISECALRWWAPPRMLLNIEEEEEEEEEEGGDTMGLGLGLLGFGGSEFCGGLDSGSRVSIEEEMVEKRKRRKRKKKARF